ncbi:MAG: NAD(P)/FAD-dependent oxidoreductase [Oscillospiraceae bacterium]|nr:NAD(P)/FAD-dependent oxidoreductase [Oscillospiraceae bacterium]
MSVYDIAVIGTGPGGISAAVTAAVRNKSVLLIGEKGLSSKMRKAKEILNYPGFPRTSGEELADRFQAHLDSMGIPVTEDRITAVYDMGGTFGLQGRSGEMYTARSVILAMGVVSAASIPGEDELLGSGVSYCATCDAPLYRGKTVAVIGYSPDEEAEGAFLSEVASKVYYLPMYKGDVSLDGDNIEVIHSRPVRIERGRLVTDDAEYEADGVFVLRESVAPAKLIYGLETDGAHVVTDRQMQTNLKGVFACGDITGRPYQYIKAAGEGNVCALSCVKYLDETKKM